MIKTNKIHPLISFFDIKQYCSVLVILLVTFNVSDATNLLSTNHSALKKGTIGYYLWLDLDENSQYDIGERILKNYKITLYQSKEDKLIKEMHVLDEGRFYFKDLSKGKYYIKIVFEDQGNNRLLRPVKAKQIQTGHDVFSFESDVFDFDPEEGRRKNLDFAFRYPEEDVIQDNFLMCTDFIDTSDIEIVIENCDNFVSICIEEPIADMLGYTITDNGLAYNAGINPCDFDTSFAYTYTGIPGAGTSGPYSINSWTVDGNIFTGMVVNMSDLTDSMNVWDTDGSWVHDNLTGSIRGGISSINYSDIIISQTATGNSGTMFLSTNLNPNGSQITLDTGYHQLIFTDPNNGCMDTLEIQVNCIPCLELYTGETSFELDNCDDSQSICFDISENEFLDYSVSSNGLTYNDPINPCSRDSFFKYDYSGLPGGGSVGPYYLQSWSINGSLFLGGFNSIGDLVDSMNVWDSGAIWEISDPLQTITGGNSFNTYGDIEVLQLGTNISGEAPVEQVASITSVEVIIDTGFYEVVFYNETNQCADTFDFEINCTPCPEYLGGGMVNLTASHCDSSTAVCLPIPFSEISNYTTSINGNLYNDGFITCSDTASEIQLDTGYFQIIMVHDITGCRDSLEIEIGCLPPVICSDFLNENFVPLTLSDCGTTTDLCIEIPFAEIANYSVEVNNIPYTGTLNDCSGSTGISLNSGVYEVIISVNSTGCSDTINTLVACLISDEINVTIPVGQMDTICLDTFELPGGILSVNNICENNSGEFSLVEIDEQTYCVSYEGIEEGLEQACIEICDSLGFCDTTYINIEVESSIIVEPELGPNAEDDFVLIAQGQSIIIDVLSNDEPNGLINAFGILENSENGTAVIRADNTIQYIPNPDYCRSTMPDSVVYTLCNEIDCDQAIIYIDVECEEILVHNGFSPNGDGRNDYFVIKGAASSPDNSLSIFNRWGGRVHHINHYQNDWNGTWNGEDLPDGTYFYYYKDGNGSSKTGYLILRR